MTVASQLAIEQVLFRDKGAQRGTESRRWSRAIALYQANSFAPWRECLGLAARIPAFSISI